MSNEDRALTPKQQRFCDEYLVDLNACAAAIRAGYSRKTARFIGAENLTKPNIAAAIAQRQLELQERTQATQERVITELARIAFGDQRRLMQWGAKGVSLRDSATISDADAATVAEVAETRTKDGGSLRIKTHDKVLALKLLGEHLGMFKRRVEHSGPSGGAIPMAGISMTPEEFEATARRLAQEV